MRLAPVILAAVLSGCTLLVPAPGGAPAPAAPASAPSPVGAPGVIAFPPTAAPVTARAFDARTPAFPVLLQRLRTLEEPDGALIVTRGAILDDVAGVAGGKRMLHDPVLDDGPGSVRLLPSQHVLEAARKGPRLVRGILQQKGAVPRLEVLSVEPFPVTEMSGLTVDDRIYEPGERLTLSPGLHRISIEAPGLTAVEFLEDLGDGPLDRIGRDDDPSDGFSATWIASALENGTIRTVGFTLFDEAVQGPSLDVKIGPPLDF